MVHFLIIFLVQFSIIIYNLKSDYEAVHGAVTAAAPKVFLKYFFINTKTGEKSGEVLGEISL